jgi:hypothetical protein
MWPVQYALNPTATPDRFLTETNMRTYLNYVLAFITPTAHADEIRYELFIF